MCIWHKVVPVKTVNHPCSEMRVNLQPGEEVGSGQPCYQLILLGKGPETFRSRTQILNQNLSKSSIVPISQNRSLNNSFIFLFFFFLREQQSVVHLQNPPAISGFWLKTLYTIFVFCFVFLWLLLWGGGGGSVKRPVSIIREHFSLKISSKCQSILKINHSSWSSWKDEFLRIIWWLLEYL